MSRNNPKDTGEEIFSTDYFLRSINLQYEAEFPDRIGHFIPTAKSVLLLNALFGMEADKAFFVVAPYGSGKSLTAAYALHLIENRPSSKEVLVQLEKRLLEVSESLGKFAAQRRKRGRQGLVIPIHTYNSSLPQEIKSRALEALRRIKLGREARSLEKLPSENIQDTIRFLAKLEELAKVKKLDRIVILWDEFGRHIEKLLSEGQSSSLNEIQLLAEFVSRAKEVPMTLGLLVHQRLLNYASNVPHSVRAEWTKVEGRFRTIQYVDDSKEIYRLLGDMVSARRSIYPSPENKKQTAQATKFNIFKDFKKTELAETLEKAFPLHPVTVYLLPRISGRVAQNERTLFSFLYSVSLNENVFPHHIFDYFSNDMRADTSIGGSYRQWLETESSLTKVADDEVAQAIIKTTCLLGLGLSGERSRASRKFLLFALEGFADSKVIERSVDELIERKLLLYRRHNDEVSVWHGTDIDLRNKLEDEKHRCRPGFDLAQFLASEVKAPVWKPNEYNDDFCVRRYLVGEFKSFGDLERLASFEWKENELPLDCDGKIIYVLPSDTQELKKTEAIAKNLVHSRLIIAIPQEPLPINKTALEIWCLMRLLNDPELMSQDPLLPAEIHQMLDDAWGHLHRLLDRLVNPGPKGPKWFYKGAPILVQNPTELRRTLSVIMRDVYSKTPILNNELIVRKKPSAVVINSRKRLNMAILERSGQENLGLEGFTPDVSMFRTILLKTGLYRENGGRWGYADYEEIKDPGLQAVWEKLGQFFTVPSPEEKQPADLFSELTAPPFGIRAGLLPILFATALKAFPTAISITKEGEFLSDILPSNIEDLCRHPNKYRVRVLDISGKKAEYLKRFHKLFSPVANYEVPNSDLVRLCFDALEAWKAQMPPAALNSQDVPEAAQRFQKLVRPDCKEPAKLLLQDIPEAFSLKMVGYPKIIENLEAVKKELEFVVVQYKENALKTIQRTLSFGEKKDSEDTKFLARGWASCFPESFTQQLGDKVLQGLLSRMVMEYESDDRFLDSISSLLIGKTVNRWDDSAAIQFARNFPEAVHRIEEAAIRNDIVAMNDGKAVEGLEKLLSGRLRDLLTRLVDLVGSEKAIQITDQLKASVKEEFH